MAMLKDSVVSGSLRVTDKAYTDGMQARIVTAPTTSGGSTYGPGSNGQVLRSNGTTSYWSSLGAGDVGAVASNQGTGNAGKWLIVNSSGVVTPTSITTRSSSDLTASGATVTAPAGYYSAAATKTIGNGTVVASVSSNSGGSASMAATGFTASSSATSYYVTLSTSAGSVKAKAVGGTAGYVTSSTTNETAATSVAVSGNGNKLYIPAGGITASVSSNSGGSASMAATGFTASSSATSYYVTLSTSAGSVKAKAVGSTAGYITTSASNETGATSVSVSGNGNKLYIPAGSVTASVSSNSGGSASMAATGFTASSSATSYYVTLSTSAGSVKAKAAGNAAGYITSSTTNETGATSVAVSGNGNKLYIPAATPAFTGGGVSGSSDATFSNITTSSTDNGIKIQTRYSASRTAVTYNGAVAGYVSISSGTSASAAASVSNQNGTAYYVTGITVPKDKTFSVTTTADTALDTTSDISITNNAYRRVVVDNKGTTRAVTNTNGTGFISIGAFADSSATALSSFEVVSSGRWNQAGITIAGGGLSNTTNYSGTPTVSLSLDSQSTSGIGITDTAQSSGYYVKLTGSTAKLTGSTTVTRAAVTDTRTEGHLFARSSTTIISSGTSSPSVTVNAASKTRYLTLPTATFAISGASVYCSAGGWVPTGSTSSVLKTISSATPAFTGGGVSGSSDATFSNVTTSSTDNGIKIQTRYSASRTAVTYNGAVAGYVSVSSGTTASAAASVSNQNGTAYYITSINVPKDKAFEVTMSADTALDASSTTSVTTAAYRRAALYNVANSVSNVINYENGTTYLTNGGTTSVTHNATYKGTTSVLALNPSDEGETKTIVSNGKWVQTNVSATGTYWGRVTVNGGTISNPQITIDLDGDPSTAVVNARTDFTSGFISQSSYVADGIFIPKYGGQLIKPSTTSNTVLTRGSIIGGDITIAKLEPTPVSVAQFTQDSTASKSASKVYYGQLTIRAQLAPNHVYIVYGIGISSGFMTGGLPMLYGPLPKTVSSDSSGYIVLSGCYFHSGGSLGTGTFRLYVQEV